MLDCVDAILKLDRIVIAGGPGCGKTTLAQEVGHEMNIPVHIVNCPSITSDEKWVGHKEFREGKTEYVLSEMLRWISSPGWKIVLFDEPTAGLDPPMAEAIEDLILETQQRLGRTFVVITHSITTAFHVAHKIAMHDRLVEALDRITAFVERHGVVGVSSMHVDFVILKDMKKLIAEAKAGPK